MLRVTQWITIRCSQKMLSAEYHCRLSWSLERLSWKWTGANLRLKPTENHLRNRLPSPRLKSLRFVWMESWSWFSMRFFGETLTESQCWVVIPLAFVWLATAGWPHVGYGFWTTNSQDPCQGVGYRIVFIAGKALLIYSNWSSWPSWPIDTNCDSMNGPASTEAPHALLHGNVAKGGASRFFFHMTPGRDAKTSLRFVTLSPNTFLGNKATDGTYRHPIDQNNPKYWFPEFSFDSGPNHLQPCNNMHLQFDSSEGEETCQWDPQQAWLFNVFRLFFYNTVPINKAKSKPLGSVLWQALQGHDWKSRGIERQPGQQQQWPDCCKLSWSASLCCAWSSGHHSNCESDGCLRQEPGDSLYAAGGMVKLPSKSSNIMAAARLGLPRNQLAARRIVGKVWVGCFASCFWLSYCVARLSFVFHICSIFGQSCPTLQGPCFLQHEENVREPL